MFMLGKSTQLFVVSNKPFAQRSTFTTASNGGMGRLPWCFTSSAFGTDKPRAAAGSSKACTSFPKDESTSFASVPTPFEPLSSKTALTKSIMWAEWSHRGSPLDAETDWYSVRGFTDSAWLRCHIERDTGSCSSEGKLRPCRRSLMPPMSFAMPSIFCSLNE